MTIYFHVVCSHKTPERNNCDSSYKVFKLNNHNSSLGKLSPQEPKEGPGVGNSVICDGKCGTRDLSSCFHPNQGENGSAFETLAICIKLPLIATLKSFLQFLFNAQYCLRHSASSMPVWRAQSLRKIKSQSNLSCPFLGFCCSPCSRILFLNVLLSQGGVILWLYRCFRFGYSVFLSCFRQRHPGNPLWMLSSMAHCSSRSLPPQQFSFLGVPSPLQGSSFLARLLQQPSLVSLTHTVLKWTVSPN